ncbi:hypothetical protein [Aneurinibacillus tyrosinisolvens]|uniref:hypothetical protein n=1 Tax=Aneurinibacillus tyrosinisolvens TaxID=1443435 RepID=UPI00063EDA37|nr:hypothetical protein [Aneurinibacillus tyrosinisolvens]
MKMSFANWDEIIELCGGYSSRNPVEEMNRPISRRGPQQRRAVEPMLAEEANAASLNDDWTEKAYDTMLDREYGINVFSSSLT